MPLQRISEIFGFAHKTTPENIRAQGAHPSATNASARANPDERNIAVRNGNNTVPWEQICGRQDCRGRWVALQSCRYDSTTGRAAEGTVVDMDDDLAELCSRVSASDWKDCAIVYCADR